MKKILLLISFFICLLADAQQISQNQGVPWPATDGLQRALPMSDQVKPPQKDKFVGIFYFLWHPANDDTTMDSKGPYNITEILTKNPKAMNEYDAWGDYLVSDTTKSYFEQILHWNEPLFGYYYLDPWVLRKHAILLADAGIDVLIFDATNALTYKNTYFRLCDQYMKLRAMGEKTPQIAFMLNSEVKKTANLLWTELYKNKHFKKLWFFWKGKPLMVADPNEVDSKLTGFFTFRKAYWPDGQGKNFDTHNQWQWEVPYPQPFSFDQDSTIPEYMNVSIAQNLSRFDGSVTLMSQGKARGRSFHDGHQPTDFLPPYPEVTKYGKNFQEQWNRALSVNPEFIFITGWNEWIVGRGVNYTWWGKGAAQFCDQFSDEFSRDIEMSKGNLSDDYYYQMVTNIRKFKGTEPITVNHRLQTIPMDKSFKAWQQVTSIYHDHLGDVIHRNNKGYGKVQYINNTGRNDIVICKVTNDTQNIYFYVQTNDDLSPRSDKNWMWLFIDSDQNHATGFEGYDVLINRKYLPVDSATIEIYQNHSWTKIGKVPMKWNHNQLQLSVPCSYLNISFTHPQFSFDFKWVDNMQHENDIMDFYLYGDVAPEGRFNYRYTFSEKQ